VYAGLHTQNQKKTQEGKARNCSPRFSRKSRKKNLKTQRRTPAKRTAQKERQMRPMRKQMMRPMRRHHAAKMRTMVPRKDLRKATAVDSGRRKQVTVTGDSNKTASEQRIPKKPKTAEEKKKAEEGKGEKGKKVKKAKKDEKDKKAKKDSTRNTGAPPLQCLPVHQLFYNAYVHESMCACKPVCRAGGRGPSDSDLFKCCAKGQHKPKKKSQKARITTGPCTGPRLALPSNDIDIDINDIDFND
jgi:hypothetical protein